MSKCSFSMIQKQFFSASLSSVLGLGLVVGTGLSAYAIEAKSNRLVTYQDDEKTLFALSLIPTQEFVAKKFAACRSRGRHIRVAEW